MDPRTESEERFRGPILLPVPVAKHNEFVFELDNHTFHDGTEASQLLERLTQEGKDFIERHRSDTLVYAFNFIFSAKSAASDEHLIVSHMHTSSLTNDREEFFARAQRFFESPHPDLPDCKQQIINRLSCAGPCNLIFRIGFYRETISMPMSGEGVSKEEGVKAIEEFLSPV